MTRICCGEARGSVRVSCDRGLRNQGRRATFQDDIAWSRQKCSTDSARARSGRTDPDPAALRISRAQPQNGGADRGDLRGPLQIHNAGAAAALTGRSATAHELRPRRPGASDASTASDTAGTRRRRSRISRPMSRLAGTTAGGTATAVGLRERLRTPTSDRAGDALY